MRYSFKFKLESVDLYKQGKWPPCPNGIKSIQDFRRMVRYWARAVDANGPEVLKHNNKKTKWMPPVRYRRHPSVNLVSKHVSSFLGTYQHRGR
ncbi:hypothetical protein HMPREF1632_05215 [Mageeibacillus indolicus 0009-5]|nr:hypothetical protein HMPREF1632_05215 [Mageeibacillus indolicus 0009-5]